MSTSTLEFDPLLKDLRERFLARLRSTLAAKDEEIRNLRVEITKLKKELESKMENEHTFGREENHTLSSSFVSDDHDEGTLNTILVVTEEGRGSPLWSRAMGEESSTLAAVETTSPEQIDKQNGSPQSLVFDTSNILSEIGNQGVFPMKSETKFDMPIIWSRRGKSVDSTQVEIAKRSVKKVNGTSKQDKENSAPRPALGLKLMRKEVGSDEVWNTGSFDSKVRSGMSHANQGRVPSQPLLSIDSSSYNTISRSCDSTNFCQFTQSNCVSFPTNQYGEEGNDRRWNMVVDTGCFLDMDSCKSIKLLEGIKGTHLIIPSIVIRELDSLKGRGSLFRSAPEVSSSYVLDWIEEHMVKKNSWLHVQNSLEGIASSTAQDHILNCALFFKRRMKINECVVLLSKDVPLKIKAMAEGLICETAEEFRESLVNPYSERFMLAGSTPREPTWSSFHDTSVLRKKCSVKKTKSAACSKGLKQLLSFTVH